MKLEKVLNIVLVVLIVVSAFLIVSLMSNIGEDTDPTMGAWINTNITWAYILLFAAIAAAVIFSLIQTLTDKRAAKRGLVGLVSVVVVVGVSYLFASDKMPQFYGVEKFVADGTLTNTVSKWIDTTLITTYILLALLIIATAAASVSRIFK